LSNIFRGHVGKAIHHVFYFLKALIKSSVLAAVSFLNKRDILLDCVMTFVAVILLLQRPINHIALCFSRYALTGWCTILRHFGSNVHCALKEQFRYCLMCQQNISLYVMHKS